MSSPHKCRVRNPQGLRAQTADLSLTLSFQNTGDLWTYDWKSVSSFWVLILMIFKNERSQVDSGSSGQPCDSDHIHLHLCHLPIVSRRAFMTLKGTEVMRGFHSSFNGEHVCGIQISQ